MLDPEDAADKATLDQLRADPVIEFVDHRATQIAELRGLLPPPGPELADEPGRWAYYPWRRAVVAVLGPRGFRAVRLDRNRNVITTDEQTRLGELRIGVAGLSAGHVIAHTIAAQTYRNPRRERFLKPVVIVHRTLFVALDVCQYRYLFAFE